jgi:hypothetical protein
MPQIDYSDKYVAFIDMLGFKQLVQSFRTNHRRLEEMHEVLERLKERERRDSIRSCKITAFSDSIIVSANTDSLSDLIHLCGELQANMLVQGILLRGGVSKGLTFHNDGIVYGEGLIRAYELESGFANYPRIVVDHEIVPKLAEIMLPIYYALDEDGLIRVNPFGYSGAVFGPMSDPWDRQDVREDFLSRVRWHLESQKKTITHRGALLKIEWLLTKLAIADKEQEP